MLDSCVFSAVCPTKLAISASVGVYPSESKNARASPASVYRGSTYAPIAVC